MLSGNKAKEMLFQFLSCSNIWSIKTFYFFQTFYVRMSQYWKQKAHFTYKIYNLVATNALILVIIKHYTPQNALHDYFFSPLQTKLLHRINMKADIPCHVIRRRFLWNKQINIITWDLNFQARKATHNHIDRTHAHLFCSIFTRAKIINVELQTGTQIGANADWRPHIKKVRWVSKHRIKIKVGWKFLFDVLWILFTSLFYAKLSSVCTPDTSTVRESGL